MKNTSQGYPRNYTANTTGDILQVAEKIYFMAKVSTTPFSLGINRISYLYEKMSQTVVLPLHHETIRLLY